MKVYCRFSIIKMILTTNADIKDIFHQIFQGAKNMKTAETEMKISTIIHTKETTEIYSKQTIHKIIITKMKNEQQ